MRRAGIIDGDLPLSNYAGNDALGVTWK